MQIELDVFSGRPNPTWELDAAQSAELSALLRDLGGPAELAADMLGYRGFVVHGQVPVRVFRGAVVVDGQAHADLHGAEAWLMHSARAQGWAAIVDAVATR